MAKIAVSSQGQDLQSQVDPRFGRAAYFLVIDEQDMSCTVLDNTQARDMSSGAGIQAAETVARAGATVIVTGMVGPKAYQALETAGVAVVQDAKGSVEEAVQAYRAGSLGSGDSSPAGGRGKGGGGGGGGKGGGKGGGRGMGGGGGRGGCRR